MPSEGGSGKLHLPVISLEFQVSKCGHGYFTFSPLDYNQMSFSQFLEQKRPDADILHWPKLDYHFAEYLHPRWFASWKLLLYQVMQVSSRLHIFYEICQYLSFVYHRSFTVKKEALQITMFISLFESPQTKHPQRVHRNKSTKYVAELLTMLKFFCTYLIPKHVGRSTNFPFKMFSKTTYLLATSLNYSSYDFPPHFKMNLQGF